MNLKIIKYKTVILSVVLSSFETSLILKEVPRLRVVENNILRRISELINY
jgi:hypothetical protein